MDSDYVFTATAVRDGAIGDEWTFLKGSMDASFIPALFCVDGMETVEVVIREYDEGDENSLSCFFAESGELLYIVDDDGIWQQYEVGLSADINHHIAILGKVYTLSIEEDDGAQQLEFAIIRAVEAQLTEGDALSDQALDYISNYASELANLLSEESY
jgi:hypothetical protein